MCAVVYVCARAEQQGKKCEVAVCMYVYVGNVQYASL